ncbi:hypothetical protein JCM10212_003309 [Sporobolomyces blumeae]
MGAMPTPLHLGPALASTDPGATPGPTMSVADDTDVDGGGYVVSVSGSAAQPVEPSPSTDSYASRPDGRGLDWAPRSPAPTGLAPSNLAHLPNISPRSANQVYVLTSKPCSLPLSPMQESMSYSLARLLSLPRFLSFLATPLGYSQFKAYLATNAPGLNDDLDMWHDIVTLRSLTAQAAFASRGLFDVYRDEIASFPTKVADGLIEALRECTTIGGGLDGAAKHLLDSLYASQFQARLVLFASLRVFGSHGRFLHRLQEFMKTRLVKYTSAQLANYTLSTEDRSGIGAAFVLVNPRLQDRPIVLVSPGFTELTGYTAKQIIGRNCRFLQGKGTSPSAVAAIKRAIDAGQELTQIILNYRADARPFMNLLTIIPLHDVKGELTYFIGGQTDLTSAMMDDRGALALRLPEDEVLNVDMTHFSEPVQVEARETAHLAASEYQVKRAFGVAQHNSPVVVIPSLASTHEDEHHGSTSSTAASKDLTLAGKQPPKIEKLKIVVDRWFGKKKKKREAHKPSPPVFDLAVPLAPKRPLPPSNPAPVEAVALDWSSAYEKLLVVKHDTRQILFATSGFLRFVGLPGATPLDVAQSPLIYLDLLELVVAPNDTETTKETRRKVKAALDEPRQCSVGCGIRYKDKRAAGFHAPPVIGRLYIAPLNDWCGDIAASAVIFA